MRGISIIVMALAVGAGAAHAQYPARGLPDPSFNGGRPRVIAATPAGGQDRGTQVSALSATRFVVMDSRSSESNDAVIVVDTTPERATVFDLAFTPAADLEIAFAMMPIGSGIVIGGAVEVGTDRMAAALQMRSIGDAATPTFTEAGTLLTPPVGTAQPLLYTSALAGDAGGAAGALRIWQAITAYTADYSCSGGTLTRLDYVGGAFSARDQLDLSSALSRPCYEPLLSLRRTRGVAAGSAVVLLAGQCADGPTGQRYVCVTRVVDDGTALSVDRTYGFLGLAVYGPLTGMDMFVGGMVEDADGNLVIAVTRQDFAGRNTPLLVRFRENGVLDAPFGIGAVLAVDVGGGMGVAASVAIDARGALQVVGTSDGPSGVRPYIASYDPVARTWRSVRTEFTATEPNYAAAGYVSVVALPAGGALAVGAVQDTLSTGHTLVARLAGDTQTVDVLEYRHAGFDHYFVTSLQDEMRKLDDGTFAGWARTGQAFAALPVGAAGASDVCRFFSVAFAPKSSHFYTPLPGECALLKTGVVWDYEGLVFALKTPDAGGACPPATRPLYRLYNDGQGAAPNHRYVVDEAARAAQAARGWIGEGNGSPPVFACVPA
jgi:hypothetical protein